MNSRMSVDTSIVPGQRKGEKTKKAVSPLHTSTFVHDTQVPSLSLLVISFLRYFLMFTFTLVKIQQPGMIFHKTYNIFETVFKVDSFSYVELATDGAR